MTASLRKAHQQEQTICIDLPGEAVNCWNEKARKVRVVLRKHRDVIFDISLEENALYSVYSEKDPFYDAMEKKLVPAGKEVNFFNGTLKHFWVGRGFRGAMVLKKNGTLIGRYFPYEPNGVHIGEEPRVKPAPLLVVMKSHEWRHSDTYSQVLSRDRSGSDERFTLIVQLDIEDKGMPRELLEYLMHGSDKELFYSGNVITRNWVFNQIAAQLGFTSDNLNWIKELWGKRLKFQKIRGTLSVILTGNKQARQYLTANWYGAKNAKVIAFSFGVGSAQGLRNAGWGAIKGMTGKGGVATICFVIAIDVAEWLKEYEDKDPITGLPKRDWNDLFIKVGTDIGKAAIGGVLTAAVGWILATVVTSAAALFGATIALPVLVICTGVIVLNVAVGFLVDLADQQFGLSDSLRNAVKPSLEKLEKDFGADYQGFDSAVGQALAYGGLGA
ncbi:hypothetical protein [Duganella sp. Root198D2]|uniref:hypothetical protein n=1 Tax=Duganella sp. Root198D2 TaxID=1736489 RepID=UPI00070C7E69|nr:hypothetical protein [Duganella sp. Root198D2]KRB97007.1 hypothetical protein ASE26_02925 [Duganella sp. Root198D2]